MKIKSVVLFIKILTVFVLNRNSNTCFQSMQHRRKRNDFQEIEPNEDETVALPRTEDSSSLQDENVMTALVGLKIIPTTNRSDNTESVKENSEKDGSMPPFNLEEGEADYLTELPNQLPLELMMPLKPLNFTQTDLGKSSISVYQSWAF